MKYKFKVFSVILALSSDEKRHLGKIFRSNFFTSRLHIKKLYHVLIRKLDHDSPSPSPEFLFAQIYPNSDYNDVLFRKALSELRGFIEEGLLLKAYKSDNHSNQIRLLRIYREHHLTKPFTTLLKKAFSQLEHQTKRDQGYYEQLLALQQEKSHYFEGSKKAEDLFLQDLADNEDIIYLIKKLRIACGQLSHQRVLQKPYDFGLLPQLIKTIEQEKYLSIPAIAINYYCYQFLSHPEQAEYFQKLKSTLNEYRAQFSNIDLAAAYRLAINFCIRKNNEGENNYLQELWELYTNGLEQGILLKNNYIPRFTFDNALTAGLRLQKYEWASTFIEDKSSLLDPNYREQSVLFNLGKLAFEKNEFETSLAHLQRADFKEIRINIVAKILLTKVLFELNYLDSLEAHLDNFQQFIRRKEVNEYHSKNVLNIIRYVRKLISTPQFNKAGRISMKEKINGEKVLSEKEWLVKKV